MALKTNAKRRVVVTGMGVVSPLATTREATWQALLAGQSGVNSITHFDASEFSCQIAATVDNFDAQAYFSPREIKRIDLFIQYGIVAAEEAWQDAAIKLNGTSTSLAGVLMGSGIGGLSFNQRTTLTLTEQGPRKISPFAISGSVINMLSGNVALRLGLHGPNLAISTACSTGSHCIGMGARLIACGDADIMIVGGAEQAATSVGIGAFAAMRALSTRNEQPHQASRPWDIQRDGFVLGDGAGALVLEELGHAETRGAKIYAELRGFGMSADGYHITQPEKDGRGAKEAIVKSLADASLSPQDIQYVNAHGTSTPLGDVVEARALESVFSSHKEPLKVSSVKSSFGHLLGAAGAVEGVCSVLSLRDQIAPPTINLEQPDQDYRLDFIPHEARHFPIQHVLSNSFGFGGTNASLIFSQYNS